MFFIVFSMLLALAASAVVLGYVVLQARRDGREVLTPYGHDVLERLRPGSGDSEPSVPASDAGDDDREGALAGRRSA